MCTVSMIGDHYTEKWTQVPQWIYHTSDGTQVTRAEFDKLAAEVAEMIALMKRAKKYDEDNGEPACELEEKISLLRLVARLVGVDFDKEVGRLAT